MRPIWVASLRSRCWRACVVQLTCGSFNRMPAIWISSQPKMRRSVSTSLLRPSCCDGVSWILLSDSRQFSSVRIILPNCRGKAVFCVIPNVDFVGRLPHRTPYGFVSGHFSPRTRTTTAQKYRENSRHNSHARLDDTEWMSAWHLPKTKTSLVRSQLSLQVWLFLHYTLFVRYGVVDRGRHIDRAHATHPNICANCWME